jgi:hypothetical protein
MFTNKSPGKLTRRITMTLTIEYIKKLMGWCPNAQANRAERHTHLEDNYMNTLDSARGKIGSQNNLGWF